ncbi:hypothetical protein VTK73DRAFT_7797 [Phialemonium thermophilum]|uniref:Elongation factor 1-beta n=1 Tax=Phialemonium thermophilum TaxID=223376 RepID=A0ABR3WCH9_9PEZI
MGFSDLTTDAGLASLDQWLSSRSYVDGDAPTQADVAVFKAVTASPDSAKYPNAAKWYSDISARESDFASLPGDASKPYTAYGTAAAAAADDDEDLFGSDDDDDDPEAARIREERLAEYNKKKAAKPKPVAKSLVTLDVKPWDDETDLEAMEAAVRAIEHDGLVWGASQLIPIGFGIKKLQINMVVEDAKISLADLEEEIQELEDYVQSTDIAAMQKL